MRYSTVATLAAVARLAQAQTFTDCNPLSASNCPTDPALGTTLNTDFTKGESGDWTLADGTTMSYDGSNGAVFTIGTATEAPTISSAKYIFFGKVDVTMKAAPGQGIVSSFILESDDLDEIDWEWIGSVDINVESNFFGKGNTTTYNRALYHDVADPVGTFHTYTIDWSKEQINWSIDGNVVRTLPYADSLTLGGANYPQTPMRIKMGNWVGCANASAASNPATQGTCEWAGGPADFSAEPFNMYVQSVVIQDYGCAQTYAYGDNSGSYQSIVSNGGCAAGGSSGSSGSSSVVSSAASSATGSATGSATSKPSSSGAPSSSAANSTATDASSTLSHSKTASSESSAVTTSVVVSSNSTSTFVVTVGATSTHTGATTNPPTGSPTAVPNAATKYGTLDYAVVVLGLGLGYLVM